MAQPLKTAPGGIVRKVAWTPVVERRVIFARSRSQEKLFYTVGGKIDEGETSLQALVREVAEETGATLLPDTIKLIRTFVGPCHGYVEGTQLHMECYNAAHAGDIAPAREIAELAWFTTADTDRTTDMGRAILEWFKAQDLID